VTLVVGGKLKRRLSGIVSPTEEVAGGLHGVRVDGIKRRSCSEEEERITGCSWANRPNGPAALPRKNKRKSKWATITDWAEMKDKNRFFLKF
jgi:hypothetical protein